MPSPRPAFAAPAAAPVAAPVRDDVFYPSSDGKPMSENMWQGAVIVNAVSDLEEAHPGALVAPDILVYPEKGNSANKIGPDVLVAFGIGTEKRSVYLVWQEGKPPDWVLEVASPSTQAKDRDHKRFRYAAMGVPEYWLFDPKGDVYPRGTPSLQGLGLVDGEYLPLESRLVDGKRMIHSKVLGLDVRGEDELLRFWDPVKRRYIEHRPEVSAARERAHARAEREATRANREAAVRSAAEARASRAEALVAELEAALKRLRSNDSP